MLERKFEIQLLISVRQFFLPYYISSILYRYLKYKKIN